MKSAPQQYHNVRHRYRTNRLVQTLERIGLGLFLILFSFGALSAYAYTRADGRTHVSAAVPATLNFQARLLQSNGAIVADGNYSIVFNLYAASSGGSSAWSETHASTSVRAGYLSVYLGSVDNDLDTLDWSQQYWLTMNVDGDGEMNPRLELTSVPYSFRSGQADTLTNGADTLGASDLVQLAPSSVQAINTALAALRINQTGAGLLAELQGNGSNVFTIEKDGDVASSGSATFSGGTLNLGAAAQAGGLVLNDGSNNTGTLQTEALGQNTVYSLPDPGGVSATICLSTGNCGGTGNINDGGNTFGSAITLGTNDTFGFNFETGGVDRVTIDTSGNLDIIGGGLQIADTTVLNGSRALSNLTGIDSTGTITFGSLSSGGIVKADTSGNLSIATAGTDYETPITFSNGLTRTGNAITLGGTLSGLTDIATGSNNLTLSGSGLIGIGSTSAQYKLDIRTPGSSVPQLHIASTDTDTGGYLASGGASNFFASAGASWNGAQWIAKSTTSSVFGANNGAFSIYTDSGLTEGAAYIPTARFTIGATGNLLINSALSNLSSGALQTAGVTRLTNGGVLQNITGLTVTSGGANITGGFDNNSGGITESGSITGVGANITATSGLTVASGGSGALTLDSASNTLVLADSTLQYAGAGLTLDVNNAGLSTLNIANNNGSNLANLDVEGAIFAGNGNAFQVNSDGDITSAFTALDGTSTTNGTSGGGISSSLVLNNAANFDIGNYVQINDTDCGGAGINICYAKITAKAVNTLTISPGLVWTNSVTVNEYHIPEIGGTNTSQPVANRYGRGYFISGVVTGNGSTYYNGHEIMTTYDSFSLLNDNVATLDIAGDATTVNIGNSNTLVSILGSLETSASEIITAGGGLVVSSGGAIISGGIDNNSGGITETGALSGVTTISASGAITAATSTNTINGLVINAGALSGVTGITFASGSLNLNNGGITNTGSIAGATTISASGAITAATSSNTINGLVINGGVLSSVAGITLTSGSLNLANGGISNTGAIAGATTIGASGLATLTGGATVSGATIDLNAGSNFATNINTGASSGTVSIGGGNSPLVINSTNFDVSSAGALSGITTLGLSGTITGATSTDTINGLVINAGALSSVSGITFTSGSLNLASGGITNTGSLAGVTTISSSGLATISGGAIISGATINLNAGSDFATNINTGASSGTVTIGGGSAPLVINSTAFDVTSAGALSGITTISTSGAITAATATNTINGLIVNAGSLSGITGFAQTSGTYSVTGTGAITLGGGSNALTINSTAFDVTSAGAVSGVTSLAASSTISTSGNINVTGTGVYQIDGTNGLTLSCGNNQHPDQLDIVGGIITGSAGCEGVGLSDARVKTNIVSLDNSILNRIKEVNTVNFDFDCSNEIFMGNGGNLSCDNERQTGVIAQELAQVFPELVYQGEDGYYRVKYDALNIYTLKSVQELNDKVENQNTGDFEQVKTAGTLRLSNEGVLQNITGLNMISGGASVIGGLNNNGGGLTNTGAILGATTIEAQSITLNAQGTGDILALKKDGNGVFTIFNTGALEMKLDSENAFAVKTSGGSTYFNVNTIRAMVSIGSVEPDDKAILFTLDAKESIDDPEGVNGASYFNSKLQRFRCYQDNRWTDCLPVGTLNDPVTLDRTAWGAQPSADTEFPGTPRILPNYSLAHEFRLRMRVTSPGAAGATCRLQFAETDEGPWSDLAEGGSGELAIDAAGTLATDWLKIKKEARDEVVVRVVCKGGNGLASPVFYGVSVQLR